jgi:hypothetical protein
MAWQQRAIAILKLTWNMLQSPCNMSKESFRYQYLGKLTTSETFCPSPLPTGNHPNTMLITDFPARIVIADLSDF